jgi:MFS family permease
MILATLYVPNVKGERLNPFDYIGFVLSGVGLAALVAGSAAADLNGMPIGFVVGLFAIGAVSVILYVFHARRTEAPILDLKLLRYSTFRAGIVGGSLFRIGIGALPLLLPLLFQLGFGMTPLSSGLLTFVAAIGAMGMKTVAGTILKWFGFRKVLALNSIISGALIAAPVFFTRVTPIWIMLAVLFIGGFFRSLQFTCINAISVAEVDQSEMSQATSLTSVFQQLALSIGVTAGASILQLSLAFRHSETLVAGDFPLAFLVVGAISLLSFISFVRLPRDAGEEVAGRKRVSSAAVAVANGRS